MKVVVTGGAGFIGANLVSQLVATPGFDQVTVVDDLSTGSLDNLAGVEATVLEGTILDPDLLDKCFDGADAVVHLAAVPSVPRSLARPIASHHANATGTLEVLEAARRAGSPHVIVASSSSVYGANRELPKRESMRAAPLSPYAVSKLATETYALAYASCFGLDVLAFRFFNVFGPLQAAGHAYAAVIPAFVDAAIAGRPLTVHGDGSQTRDFTYVGSVCEVIREAIRSRIVHDGPVNLAFGTRTSLNELIIELSMILGQDLCLENAAARPGDVRDSQADTTVLRTLFPDVRPVALRAGLEETVDWFRSH
jgi:UDP-glucose 4-epimerase